MSQRQSEAVARLAGSGFVLANTWSDPDGDPLGSVGDGEDDKTIAQLRDERESRWMRKGTGIGGCLGLGAMALEAIKVGIG